MTVPCFLRFCPFRALMIYCLLPRVSLRLPWAKSLLGFQPVPVWIRSSCLLFSCFGMPSGFVRDGFTFRSYGCSQTIHLPFCCCSCVTVDRLIRICYIRIFIVNFIMNFIVNFIVNFFMNFFMNSVQFFSLMTFFTSGISLMGATMFLQNYLSLPAKVR